MKIEKYKKTKASFYEVVFDNNSKYNIHEDLILKYGLLVKKELNEQELNELIRENYKYELYELALKYLKTKLRSKREIYKYLKQKEYEDIDIFGVIDILLKQGYINDSVYAKAYINDKINLSKDGPYKIIKELENKGVEQNIIEEQIVVFDEDLQLERIKFIIEKYKKANKSKSSFQLKEKIITHLATLGYEKALVISELSNFKVDDSTSRKKEYNKLHKKYSRKYDGEELEYFIKRKLYEKGYRNEED